MSSKRLRPWLGKTLGQVVSLLARRGLRTESNFGRKSGLPTFPARPDAPISLLVAHVSF